MLRKVLLFGLPIAVSAMMFLSFSKADELQCKSADFLLSDVEALSASESSGGLDCGNVTFIPNEALRTKACLNGGTRLACKQERNVCCDPSKQTTCSPIIEI